MRVRRLRRHGTADSRVRVRATLMESTPCFAVADQTTNHVKAAATAGKAVSLLSAGHQQNQFHTYA